MKQSTSSDQGQPRSWACLAYHELTSERPEYLYAISAAAFGDQARLVRDAIKQSSHTYGPTVTFDDGHISQYSLAFPMLEQMSIRAIFFVTGSWINARSGYMRWQHLEEMVRAGFEVQSHGWSHAYLTRCGSAELKNELCRSKGEIESKLGIPVNAISMPGGRWNRSVLEACREAGYDHVYTSNPCMGRKTQGGTRVLTVLGRTMVSNKMDLAQIAMVLNGRRSAAMRARHYMTGTARTLLGDRGYQFLWRVLARKEQSLEAAAARGEKEIDAIP
jgi:peptidoglycan/xylan/chitin deacetylase (PgdA/CDA1 family)